MEFAGCYGAFKIVKYLYEKKKMPLEDKSYKISLLGATIAGGEDKNLQFIKYLLDKKVNPLNIACGASFGIIAAIKYKNLKLLELFFDRGVKIFDKINENQVPLFHFIAAFAPKEVLQFVINYTQKPKTNQNKLKKNITLIKLDKSFKGLVKSEDPFNA